MSDCIMPVTPYFTTVPLASESIHTIYTNMHVLMSSPHDDAVPHKRTVTSGNHRGIIDYKVQLC